MKLIELINNSQVPITVLDAMNDKRILIERNHLDDRTEKFSNLEVKDIHIGYRKGRGFSSIIVPYLLVYASHGDIEQIKTGDAVND